VPIDTDFRSTWRVSSDHDGHPVWTRDASVDGTIHGFLVGVHMDSCIGCMKCVEACPTSVFIPGVSDTAQTVVDPVHEKDCLFCLVCELVCPTGAIDVLHERGSESTLDSLLHRA
jgi:NAD-dependent dihydropyrimidine dehydrogenase PreA subunit